MRAAVGHPSNRYDSSDRRSDHDVHNNLGRQRTRKYGRRIRVNHESVESAKCADDLPTSLLNVFIAAASS